jgi:hypothetical protein
MKTTIMAVAAVAAVALGILLGIQRQENTSLRQKVQQIEKESADKLQALQAENRRLSNQLAQASNPKPSSEQTSELMRLRAAVGSLKQTATEAVAAAEAKENPPSVMSGLARNPEMMKMLRDQQKLGLGMIYKTFAERMELPKETAEGLNDLLADSVMTNINHLTEILGAGKSAAEIDKIFTAQEAETDRQLKALLGDEGFAKFKDYNSNLASLLTAEQFKNMMLKGDKETKDAQGRKLYDLMREETSRVLADAGLPPDYQTVPTLNFRNIASEEMGEKNIQLLDTIYGSVANRAADFLSPEEVEKFGEFRKIAVNNNRLGLTMNRKIMAPPNK